jgi:serine/threonine-protein kinase
MGLVYACRHRELQGQIVAVKVLFPEVAEDKVAAARFKNEILASHGVSHPNVVRAYDTVTDRDLVAYAMEYVGGGDLASRLCGDDRLEIGEIVKLLAQMAAGCQGIHDAGIVHRDLKPENILLTNEGNVKIADFGIARNRHGPKLTEHGGVVGTIDYVAPEYMLRSQVDWRSDIYALGILAYEMVTGESPFKGDNVYATMTKRLKTDPEPPSSLRPECPAELDRIILKAMQREPENRYQAAIDMFADLQKLGADLGLPLGGAGAMFMAGQSGRSGPVVQLEVEAPTRAEVGSIPSQSKKSSHVGASMGAHGMMSVSDAHVSGHDWSEDPLAAGQDSSAEDSLVAGSHDGGSTEVLSASLIDYAVEADVNHRSTTVISDPFVGSSKEVGPDSWKSSSELKGVVSAKSDRPRGHAGRVSQPGEQRWIVRDLLEFGVAIVVGIGCGIWFLKMFAPSLMQRWHF